MSVEDEARAEGYRTYPHRDPYLEGLAYMAEERSREPLRAAYAKGYVAGASRPVTDEQVEVAARAIYEADGSWPWSWDELVEGWNANPIPDYPHLVVTMRSNARTVLEAAREAGA